MQDAQRQPLSDARLLRRGFMLEYVTLAWNVIGVCITAYAAVRARSIAIGGFGLDSVIEIGASLIVIRELRRTDSHSLRTPLRLLGVGFFAIALYITAQSGYLLWQGTHPEPSLVGIIWAGITLVAMLALAYGKWHVGSKLRNDVLLTEGKVTLVDAYLAGAVLIGLTMSAAFGWWWADPLAGIVIVFYATKEGVAALRDASQK